MDEKPQTFWTIQHAAAWTRLQRTGVLKPDARRVPHSFRPAYAWMREQAARRLPAYEGGPLLWAWRSPKPDLRRVAHLPRGTAGVRIEFTLPRAEALCSDFDSWHCVLNRCMLSLSEAEDDAFYLRPAWEQSHAELELSWERVFDLDRPAALPWIGPVKNVQAVFERLRLRDVVGVKKFVAR